MEGDISGVVVGHIGGIESNILIGDMTEQGNCRCFGARVDALGRVCKQLGLGYPRIIRHGSTRRNMNMA